MQGVRQENGSGCFIAAIATLLGKSYSDIFGIFYPGRYMWEVYDHGFQEMSVEQAAFDALTCVGIQGHRIEAKRFKTYARKNQHALLVIRWRSIPELCHTVIFDHESKSFIDPTFGTTIKKKSKLQDLESQLDFGIIIDHLPTNIEKTNVARN